MTAADFEAGDVDDRVVGVEFSICALERFRDARDGLDHLEALQKLRIDLARVADEPDNRPVLPDRQVYVEAPAFKPFRQVVNLLLRRAGLQYCDHFILPP
jgi:hypothetical protein